MPHNQIKVCVDRLLFDRMPAPATALPPGVEAPLSLALVRTWPTGRVLRVRFLDGDPVIQQHLQPFAHEWSKYADIKFVFGNDPDAEIRISFKDSGSWSYIGLDNLGIPKTRPTMNFGWLTRTTSDDEYSRVVTHEFGHALGCIHEHQNPSTDIPWDKPKVYAYYAGPPNNWTKDQVDTNLFKRYDRTTTQFSAFDKNSIMLYPIPEEFTIGNYTVGWNRALSDTDKQFIGSIYPLKPKLENELMIDGPAVKASIGAAGEIDTFTFSVATAGRYRIGTQGSTDVVMSLHGPGDEATLLASDDDSGPGTNPLIVRALTAGAYTVRVRHFSAKKTGDYAIQVLTQK